MVGIMQLRLITDLTALKNWKNAGLLTFETTGQARHQDYLPLMAPEVTRLPPFKAWQ
jgi:hypothetical protein